MDFLFSFLLIHIVRLEHREGAAISRSCQNVTSELWGRYVREQALLLSHILPDKTNTRSNGNYLWLMPFLGVMPSGCSVVMRAGSW